MKRIRWFLSGSRWLVLKTIMINWFIFTLLVLGYTARQFYLNHLFQTNQLEACRETMSQWETQIKSGRIILELYKEEQ